MDDETYAGFRICGDAVAEGGPVTPLSDGAQDCGVFVWAGAVEHECAVHVSIGADYEADADWGVVIFAGQQRVGSEQGLGGLNVAASGQGQGLGDGIEFGDMGGDATEAALGLG